ncbi:MAG: VOC family protein [Pseudomonadota bacterium]
MSARLVPELCVRDIEASLALYTGVFGFAVLYARDGFAKLSLEGAEVMLERLTETSWLLDAPDAPLGRGLNLEIAVSALAPILSRADAVGRVPFLAPEAVYYRTGEHYVGQRQAIFADLDGYLLRFAEPLGETATPPSGTRVVS